MTAGVPCREPVGDHDHRLAPDRRCTERRSSPWVRPWSSWSRRPRPGPSAGMLGPDFIVESSIGHIRDLPRGADEVPAAYKGEGWARLGRRRGQRLQAALRGLGPDKKSVVANLKRLLKGADELYLATDEDREGESIAWHLSEVLAPAGPGQAHGLPRDHPDGHPPGGGGVARAGPPPGRRPGGPAHPRPPLRLRGLAGAVAQGHAPALGRAGPERGHPHGGRARAGPHALPLRHLVGRGGHLRRHSRAPTPLRTPTPRSRSAARAVATGRDFTTTASRRRPRRRCGPGRGRGHGPGRRAWPASPSRSASVTEKPFRRSPAPPFMTSTLQQEAGRKLRFSAQRAMQVAQRLYEQGWITYMRTDSTTLSDEALTAARPQARELYGDRYVPDAPRRYERKVKNAQEAHEAIRPAGETFRTPDEAGRDRCRRRAAPLRADLEAHRGLADGRRHRHQRPGPPGRRRARRRPAHRRGARPSSRPAAGSSPSPGFLRAYVEGEDDPEAELADREVVLPPLAEGDVVDGQRLRARARTPPSRRPATPRPRWSRPWRSSAWAGPRPTPA